MVVPVSPGLAGRMEKEDKALAAQIGKAARKARTGLSLSQADVAERVGISTEFYGRLERGVTLPSVPTLVELARTLGIGTDVLLGLSKGARPTPAPEPTSKDQRALARRLRRASPSAVRLIGLVLAELERAEGRSRRKSTRRR